MRKHRTKEQWLALIDEFEQSGLKQSEFCAQHGINPKYFSLRRMKLKAPSAASGFVPAVLSEAQSAGQVTIHYGAVTLKMPANQAQAIAHLVKALAV